MTLKLPIFFVLLPLLTLIWCCNPKITKKSTRGTHNVRVWIEKGGVAVMEAEHALSFTTGDSGWQLNSENEGYTGTGYCTWKGPSDWGPESRPYDTALLANRKLTYRVQISTPGTYYVKVRNIHAKEDGDNDVWVSVNKSRWGKTYDHQVNQFSFDERGAWAKYELTPGISTVELAGRSHNFSVDRIVLFKESTPEKEWSRQSLPESLDRYQH